MSVETRNSNLEDKKVFPRPFQRSSDSKASPKPKAQGKDEGWAVEAKLARDENDRLLTENESDE